MANIFERSSELAECRPGTSELLVADLVQRRPGAVRGPADDKLLVARARKIQRFLSQPFTVAEVFTGTKGVQVSLKDTIQGFKEILDGKHDDIGESDFYMKGNIASIKS